LYKIALGIIFISVNIYAQLINLQLIISDGGTVGIDTLNFGLDSVATDSIDTILGEYQLPPAPPTGVFDCRFIGTDLNPQLPFGQGLNRDYRQGNSSYTGSKLYELKFQRGTGNLINIHWNLPNKITGRLYDLFGGIVVNDSMYGSGDINLTNNAINKLYMRVNYDFAIGIRKISQLIPKVTSLHQNYPNPFNSSTKIKFSNPNQCFVKLSVFDVTCKLIEILVNQMLLEGVYEVNWDASLKASGIYFYKLETENVVNTKKMILIK